MSNSVKLARHRSRFGFCHPLIRQTAVECTQAVYEQLAKNNQWYARNGNRSAWINARWRDFIVVARQNLAKMLVQPQLDTKTKDQIADALIKDNELRLGRTRAQQREMRTGQ